jgi:hypothetical protein
MYQKLIAMFLLIAATSAAAQISPQKSSQGGVTVAVTPIEVGAGVSEWKFKVVLDTHSQDLSDDLVKTSVLLDSTGRETKPLAWEGAGPGGHHREGVLKFTAFEPLPEAVELRITRPGEPAARTFSWRLK